jgi:hypothetical protein
MRTLTLCALPLLFLATRVEAAERWSIVSVDPVRMRVGDSRDWSKAVMDDRSWPKTEVSDVEWQGDIVWLRASVDVRDIRRAEGHPLAIAFSGMASHEIFWDGVRIGGGGRVARTAREEIPGPVDAVYSIPESLATEGPHIVAVRLSAFHRHFVPVTGIWGILVGDYRAMTRMLERRLWAAVACLSGLLLTAAFAIALFLLHDRSPRTLLLGTLCLTAAALLVAESWRTAFGYTYDHHLLRLVIVTALTLLVCLQLVALVVRHVQQRPDRRLLPATAVILGCCFLIPMWDGKSIAMFAIAISISAFLVLGRLRRGTGADRLAAAAVAALVAAFAFEPLRFPDAGVFVALNVFCACMLIVHVLDVRQAHAEKAEALLKSARLELELLKRQLQPHFLMNTLTALSDWVEREPSGAVRMIEALAEEMRILSDISSSRTIPLGAELRLCRVHLETMGMRMDVRYELVAENVDESEPVPPGVFHTLVENAVTHGPRNASVELRLHGLRDGDRRQYVFDSPISPGDASPLEWGTGSRYIQARLREVWGDRWRFVQGPIGERWRALIDIPAGVS